MFNFKQIVLHNFGSYGHTELDLSGRGFCLVTGKNNFKKDNAISNGAGKSFLWSAICFALTGETIQGLRTNLKNINIEEDSCYVTVYFSVDRDEFEVCRYIAPKSDLKLIKNGVDISGKGIRESEKHLAEVLPDMTKDLIASTIIIGQGLPNKFSSFSPSGRKELLEKLTKADFMIEDIKVRVSQRQQEVTLKLREYEDSELVSRTKQQEAERQVTAYTKEFEAISTANYDLDIANAAAIVTRNEAMMTSISGEITKLEGLLDGYNKRLLELTTQRNEDETRELSAYNTATAQVITSRSYLAAEIKSIEAEILKLSSIKDTCPTCGQKIPGIIRPDTSKLTETLAVKKEELKTLDTKLADYHARHVEYAAQIKKAYETDIGAVSRLASEAKTSLSNLKTKFTELTGANKQVNEQLTKFQYYKQNAEQKMQLLQTNITAANEAIKLAADNIKTIEASRIELLEHQAVLRKMESLIKRDFRGFLLSNIITYLDRRAKDFCETVFGTKELNVYLDGNALDISYCGKMFDNLSGGEKQRVDLILQFAIRDMLTVYLDISANILVLDEITDFLDKKSCAAIMSLVSKELCSVESVFLVSHHADELELPIDSEITIIKNEDGISNIQ